MLEVEHHNPRPRVTRHCSACRTWGHGPPFCTAALKHSKTQMPGFSFIDVLIIVDHLSSNKDVQKADLSTFQMLHTHVISAGKTLDDPGFNAIIDLGIVPQISVSPKMQLFIDISSQKKMPFWIISEYQLFSRYQKMYRFMSAGVFCVDSSPG